MSERNDTLLSQELTVRGQGDGRRNNVTNVEQSPRDRSSCENPSDLLLNLGLTGEPRGFCEALVLREGGMDKADQDVFWSFVKYISSLDYRGRRCLKIRADGCAHGMTVEGKDDGDTFVDDDVCGSVNKDISPVSSMAVTQVITVEGQDDDTDILFDDQEDQYGSLNNVNVSVISAKDMTHAILHCCDSFLRQELLWKMAECRLAVPVLLPGLQDTQNILFLLWGLRKIYKCWKPRNQKSPVEKSVISHALPIVGFLRFGNANISKSKLMNKIMGKLQGNNDHSYFVDIEEEPPCAKWSEGTIEAAWFLPETPCDQRGDIALKDAVTFFNLRGDALNDKLSCQREFLCRAADIIVLLVDKMSKVQRDEISKVSHMVGKCLIVCKTTSDSTTESNIKRKGKITVISSKPFLKDIGEDICKEINQVLWPLDGQEELPTCFKSIESLVHLCSKLGIEVDEKKESCVKGKKLANDIIKSVRKSPGSYKKDNLPLQEIWKTWASLDKKWHKGYRPNKKFRDIEHYHDDLKKKMTTLRKQQLLTKPGKDIVQFIEALRSPTESSQYFISWFVLYFNDLSQETLGPLRRELRDIQDATREVNAEKGKLNDKSGKSEDDKKKLIALITKDQDLFIRAQMITQKLDDGSLGLEHFMRELGQSFEAYEEMKLRGGMDVNNFIKPEKLPEIAAELLMSGYPLEILDGDVCRVPIRWVEAVFKVLTIRLKNANVCAIAVLGIQSSGKSTLLNSMFGVRFAVSAGRCTRGVFIQLFKVHEDLRGETNCDYIIIIDTEGLKAPERSTRDDFRHDNELATFALCLADLTIINIAGQTLGKDMTDVLQISAHAFIRMKVVHIKSSCRIIQQFVADLSAEEKNEACTQSILNSLDEAVAAAAKQEGYEDQYTRFSDVFNLKRDVDVQYIPSLWQGSMAPPNHRYSEKILKLKQIIVSDLKFSTRSIAQFAERTTNIWNAVKEENFIFSFQNCVVALRYKTFQHAYGKWIGDMRQAIMEWEANAKLVLKEVKSSEVDTKKRDLKVKIKTVVEDERDKVEKHILSYLQEHLKDDEDQLHTFQEEFLQDLDLTSRNFEQDAKDVLDRVADTIKEMKHMDVLLPNCKKEIREKARKHAVELRQKHSKAWSISEKEIDTKFEELWKCWINTICGKYPPRTVTLVEVESELETYIFQQGQKKDLSRGLKAKLGGTRLGKLAGKAKDFVFGNQSDIVNDIIENSLAFLQIDIEKDLAYDSAIIQKFVDHTIAALKNSYTTLTQDTMINAIVATYKRAALIIFQGRCKYNTKYSLREQLMLEKNGLQKDFRALCSNAFQDKRASENVFNLFIEKVVEVVRNYLGPAIFKAVRREHPYFASKFTLLGHVLADMAKNDKFYPYYEFIFELENFLGEWSLERIAEFCTEVTPGDTSYVHDIAISTLEEIQKYLVLSIETSVELSRSGNSDKDNGQFSNWINHLRNELLHTKLNTSIPRLRLSDEDVGNLDMFDIDDLNFFGHQVISSVKNDMITHTLNQLKVPGIKQINLAKTFLRALPSQPHNEMKKHVSGCMEQCQICHVPCDNTTKTHTIHSAALHYPEGLVGCVTQHDNRLICSICTSSVTTDDSYWDGQKHRKYCDYKKDFPNWIIQSVRNDTPLNYWKWVLNRFNEDFARMHGRNEAHLPAGWVEITKEQAIDDVIKAYITRQDVTS